jgi:hypothetical protein
MSSSSYNVKMPRGVMSVSKGSPKPTKVLKSGTAKHFVPGKSNVAFSTQGGTKK